MRIPVIERVMRRVDIQPDECWLWTGYRDPKGYGRISAGPGSGLIRPHKVVYEFTRGPIPDGLQLDHLCRVRACVNPDHLEPVTAYENFLRGESACAVNARKTHCNHGHQLSGTNLHITPSGGRRCKACALRNGRNARIRAEAS